VQTEETREEEGGLPPEEEPDIFELEGERALGQRGQHEASAGREGREKAQQAAGSRSIAAAW
jgi:hypothetical protein